MGGGHIDSDEDGFEEILGEELVENQDEDEDDLDKYSLSGDGDNLKRIKLKDAKDIRPFFSSKSKATSLIHHKIENIKVQNKNLVKSHGSSSNTYLVKEGDTLMWIAFKIYGDYGKWRSLLSANKFLRKKNAYFLRPGQKLRYFPNRKNFVWKAIGKPYLILEGDSLSKISCKVYENCNLWPKIWNNNLQSIKDPNIIFAGFTLYYTPLKQMNKLVYAPIIQ